jgi:hypothetical protein
MFSRKPLGIFFLKRKNFEFFFKKKKIWFLKTSHSVKTFMGFLENLQEFDICAGEKPLKNP